VINNRALRDAEVCLICISTKGDCARADRGEFFDCVYHCHVGFGLIFENAQLGRAIIRYRAIPIEMVGSEVEPESDGWAKGADCFELERAYLYGEHIERLLFARHFRKRLCNVSASERALSTVIQHLSQHLGRCCLPVRACNSDDRNVAGPPAQLEFADRLNSARKKIARQSG